jgi:transcriptional regulator with XRE-family HTH domain
MPSKPPLIFPAEQKRLTALGERLRLARLRRALSAEVVAARVGISRMTLSRAEHGAPAVSIAVYARILAVLNLDQDLDLVAADDRLGRRLQDLGLKTPRRVRQVAK